MNRKLNNNTKRATKKTRRKAGKNRFGSYSSKAIRMKAALLAAAAERGSPAKEQ